MYEILSNRKTPLDRIIALAIIIVPLGLFSVFPILLMDPEVIIGKDAAIILENWLVYFSDHINLEYWNSLNPGWLPHRFLLVSCMISPLVLLVVLAGTKTSWFGAWLGLVFGLLLGLFFRDAWAPSVYVFPIPIIVIGYIIDKIVSKEGLDKIWRKEFKELPSGEKKKVLFTILSAMLLGVTIPTRRRSDHPIRKD